jgi:hypothetical protein
MQYESKDSSLVYSTANVTLGETSNDCEVGRLCGSRLAGCNSNQSIGLDISRVDFCFYVFDQICEIFFHLFLSNSRSSGMGTKNLSILESSLFDSQATARLAFSLSKTWHATTI